MSEPFLCSKKIELNFIHLSKKISWWQIEPSIHYFQNLLKKSLPANK